MEKRDDLNLRYVKLVRFIVAKMAGVYHADPMDSRIERIESNANDLKSQSDTVDG